MDGFFVIFGLVKRIHDDRDEKRIDDTHTEEDKTVEVELWGDVISLAEVVEGIVNHVTEHESIEGGETAWCGGEAVRLPEKGETEESIAHQDWKRTQKRAENVWHCKSQCFGKDRIMLACLHVSNEAYPCKHTPKSDQHFHTTTVVRQLLWWGLKSVHFKDVVNINDIWERSKQLKDTANDWYNWPLTEQFDFIV